MVRRDRCILQDKNVVAYYVGSGATTLFTVSIIRRAIYTATAVVDNVNIITRVAYAILKRRARWTKSGQRSRRVRQSTRVASNIIVTKIVCQGRRPIATDATALMFYDIYVPSRERVLELYFSSIYKPSAARVCVHRCRSLARTVVPPPGMGDGLFSRSRPRRRRVERNGERST